MVGADEGGRGLTCQARGACGGLWLRSQAGPPRPGARVGVQDLPVSGAQALLLLLGLRLPVAGVSAALVRFPCRSQRRL